MITLNIEKVFHSFAVAECWRIYYDQIKTIGLQGLQVLLYIGMYKMKSIFIFKTIDNKIIFCPLQVSFRMINRSYRDSAACCRINREGACVTKQIQYSFIF